ncbi:MAG: CvpA family protein [bacterium]|nr:CvpA family protein [bacterium]
MNLLDLGIVGLLLLGALRGLWTGLLRPGLAWLGVAPGLFVAVELLPWVLEQIAEPVEQWHPLAYPLGVSAGVLVTGALAGRLVGSALGRTLQVALPESVRKADRLAGCLVAAAAVGAVVWLLVPMAATTPGWLAEQAEGSVLVRWSLQRLPPPPEGLDRVVGWVSLSPG